jgi:hypothetical protein
MGGELENKRGLPGGRDPVHPDAQGVTDPLRHQVVDDPPDDLLAPRAAHAVGRPARSAWMLGHREKR